MTYVGAEQDLVDVWVENRLKARAADFNAISAGLGSRIYNYFAPTGTPMPFLIYQAQSPPRDIRGVGAVRVMVDTLYIVKAVAQVPNFHGLRRVATLIDDAMIEENGEATTGGFVMSSVRDEQFSMVEVEDAKQFRHLGGQFRIHAQAT